ncbi:MAG TPA: histidine phosphatase family protein [Methanomassiliicoccales archaeon]
MDERQISLLLEGGKFDTVKLVVRHAERPLYRTAKAPNGVSITEKGMRDAERLGVILERNGIRMDGCSSSIVRRCIQTAELIASGNRYRQPLVTSDSLGGSPLFMDDSEALDRTLDTCSIEDIIGRQLAKDKVAGLKDVETGLRIFMGRVLADPSRSFEVFVSHDLFVCPSVHYLTATPFSTEGYTGFLEGFFIAVRDDRTKILWNSRWYDVTDRLGRLFSRGDGSE